MEEVNEIFSSPKFTKFVLLLVKNTTTNSRSGSGFVENKIHTKRKFQALHQIHNHFYFKNSVVL